MKLDLKIFDKIFAEITPLLKSGRPGDFEHIESIYKKLIHDYEAGSYTYDPRIILPAALLHDICYGFVKEEHMLLFTGQYKIPAMKATLQPLTQAYIPSLLNKYGFTESEIEKIVFLTTYSDDEVITISNPPAELILLHDLNLFDRFMPHRLKMIATLYPDKEKARAELEKSVKYIITPHLKKEAEVILGSL